MRITVDGKHYYKPIDINLTYKYNKLHKMLVKLVKFIFGLWPWAVVFGMFLMMTLLALRGYE